MVQTWTVDLAWWITVVEIPFLAGLCVFIWRQRQEIFGKIDRLKQQIDQNDLADRAALAAFKLEVAKYYASVTEMKDLERRLTAHLVRIEEKLDQVALRHGPDR
jgi:HAMP domain-containing protein